MSWISDQNLLFYLSADFTEPYLEDLWLDYHPRGKARALCKMMMLQRWDQLKSALLLHELSDTEACLARMAPLYTPRPDDFEFFRGQIPEVDSMFFSWWVDHHDGPEETLHWDAESLLHHVWRSKDLRSRVSATLFTRLSAWYQDLKIMEDLEPDLSSTRVTEWDVFVFRQTLHPTCMSMKDWIGSVARILENHLRWETIHENLTGLDPEEEWEFQELFKHALAEKTESLGRSSARPEACSVSKLTSIYGAVLEHRAAIRG